MPGGESEDLPTGHVALLFTDIEGSTRLLDELQDSYAEMLGEHDRIMREATGAGRVIDRQGDSFFVVFEQPRDAVISALQAQAALRRRRWPGGIEVRVRMGVHYGEVRLSNGSYVGMDVHLAARISDAAHGGQILISDAVLDSLSGEIPDGARITPLGSHRLKDISQPERLHQVQPIGEERVFPPPRTIDAHPNNLPLLETDLIGRGEDLEALLGLVGSHRLVTITGPGGMGKTRIALRLGSELLEASPDGVFFVALADIEEPDLVIPTVAAELGIREEPGISLQETLQRFLRDREMVLICDNFEQLVEGASSLSALLDAAPALRIVVTSRRALDISGEQEYPLGALRLPGRGTDGGSAGAAELFIRRVRTIHPDFYPDEDDSRAIAEIVVGLDGIPLAIELAAARTRSLSVGDILTRLEEPLRLLRRRGGALPERQQSMSATIGWSYDLLTEPQKALFRRLSVFAGGSDLDGIVRVCDPEEELGDPVDLLDDLVGASLVQRRTVEARSRFHLLRVVREFATERLLESAEGPTIEQRHTAYMLELVTTAAAKLTGPEMKRSLARLEIELDNSRAVLRRALDQGQPEVGLELARGLDPFWDLMAHAKEGIGWATALLDALPVGSHEKERASGHLILANSLYHEDRIAEALHHGNEAIRLFAALGEEYGLAEATYTRGWSLLAQGDPTNARVDIEAARDLYKKSGCINDAMIATRSLAVFHSMKGQPEKGIPVLEEVVQHFRGTEDLHNLAMSVAMLGELQLEVGELGAARANLSEGGAIMLELGERMPTFRLLETFALLAIKEGDPEQGAELAGAAEAMRDRGAIGLPTAFARDLRSAFQESGADMEVVEAAWKAGREKPPSEALRAFVLAPPATPRR